MEELLARFGEGLVMVRDGDRARWTYDGQTALVEAVEDGVEARFFDRPAVDAVSSLACAAVYRPRGPAYAMTPAGSARLARDLAEFFAGTREPRFAFSAVAF